MVKTPEEYFADQCFDQPASQEGSQGLTAVEQAFVRKYLGEDALPGLPVLEPEAALDSEPDRQSTPAVLSKNLLRNEARIQMVSFFVRDQIFLLPVAAIHEVLRHLPLIRLPLAPPFVAGVVNLRGRVTPLLHLDALLTNERQYRYTPQHFIIVCAGDEMQLGLIVDKVHTMYMVEQNKITWNAEAQLGAGAEFLCGIADIDDRVCGIVAPDMIVQKLLES
ncbi:chemotaxis protein CheW [Desulfovibrio sp. ZJ200]|uniref:chemotaxis protein CheW n=1 Tax=Desulfovibrio sp. ZJ200 TaxID=2709792 RepID=UPI0013ECD6F7|nr:chemotaxis protein CheW [Desulfovibrio sp. ZJ200]